MPKRFFFFSSKSKSISSSLILIKSKSRRKLHFFWQGYGLTPLKKWDFLEFEKFCFFKVKKDFFFLCKVTKHYFQSFFINCKQRKKLAFFGQKHGLSPLRKMRFFLDFEKFCFLQSKKVSFFFFKVIKHHLQSSFDQS